MFSLVESINLNLKEGGIIKNIKYFFFKKKILYIISKPFKNQKNNNSNREGHLDLI